MSDIIIKGMEMPKSCYLCPFCDYVSARCDAVRGGRDMNCKDCGNTHAALPGFPNHVFCDYYHLHMSNIADASRCEHFKPKVKTNADRIRSMTDEELAEWLAKQEYRRVAFDGWLPLCNHVMGPRTCHENGCEKCWLDWLKREVGE